MVENKDKENVEAELIVKTDEDAEENFDFLSKVNDGSKASKDDVGNQKSNTFGKRKASFNSQYSKGSGGSKRNAQPNL